MVFGAGKEQPAQPQGSSCFVRVCGRGIRARKNRASPDVAAARKGKPVEISRLAIGQQ